MKINPTHLAVALMWIEAIEAINGKMTNLARAELAATLYDEVEANGGTLPPARARELLGR